MLWDCVSYYGIGTLSPVEGTENTQKYINITDNNLWPVIAIHFGNNEYTFMDEMLQFTGQILWKVKG